MNETSKKIITTATWEEFQDTGLLLMINQVLQFFGWSIMYRYSGDKLVEVVPIKTKYRGFSDESITNSNKKFIQYMKANINSLEKDLEETE